MNGENPREIAAQVLGQRANGSYVEDLLARALASARMSSPDRRLCQELVFGVVRWQATLDWLVARKTNNRVQKAALQDLLRLGLYQIFWLERIPGHAAVHQTVELAKRRGLGPQAGFVNALLRGYIRELEPTRQLLEELKRTQPHLGFSHPEWLVERWLKRWGRELTTKWLAWNNTPPKVFARVNTLKTNAERLLPEWRDENVEYDFVRADWLEEAVAFELKQHPSLESLPSFQQGKFYVQDPSTLLAVRELAPKPGEALLDLCAAPGGKFTYAAQLMNNEGRMLAHDMAGERLKLIQENCARLGVTGAEIVSSDQLKASAQMRNFDRILVDAPCSNTGVLRRRVDLRWRIRPEEINRLAQAQGSLLAQAAQLLKPGGTLVYSTCSLEKEENQEVVAQFLKQHPTFGLERERELRPFEEGFDGAYVAKLSSKR